MSDRIFNQALTVSIVVHAILLFVLPGLKLLEPWEATEWLEVDLLAPVEVDELPALPDTSSHTTDSSGGEETSDLGDSPLFPNPPVWLPDRLNKIEDDAVSMRLNIPTDFIPDIAGSSVTAPGLMLTQDDLAGSTPVVVMPGAQPPEVTWRPSQAIIDASTDEDAGDLQISGEVASRTVIFRPPAPKPTVSRSGTILLKFWVQPDGTIGKILPITRSDPDLERVAIEYFEKWRFEAVKPEIGIQSGTIPIRFRVR
ncbi:energy transducer TonB [bacterium]|nr:energy transducer TonB [candidate division CSSED10-310 bacterium]